MKSTLGFLKGVVIGLIILGLLYSATKLIPSIPESSDYGVRDYKCTSEQMAKVERETLWVATNDAKGQYYLSHWYGMAILRNCEKRKGP